MKSLLAAAAAVALLAVPTFAADNAKPNPDVAGKSTNSDGSTGRGADGASTGLPTTGGANKNTNSDGSTGAVGANSGTSINDGAGSTADQKPASGAGSK